MARNQGPPPDYFVSTQNGYEGLAPREHSIALRTPSERSDPLGKRLLLAVRLARIARIEGWWIVQRSDDAATDLEKGGPSICGFRADAH